MFNGERVNVLVVEDYPDAAATTAMLLESYGFRVQVAGDGAAAVRIAETFRPQVVLLDIGLPGPDGYAVGRQLQEVLTLKPRIIAVTGYGGEAYRNRSQEAGFDHHLLKPVDPATLLALIREFGSNPDQLKPSCPLCR
jgi:DNA-binding response OmpR family regulator